MTTQQYITALSASEKRHDLQTKVRRLMAEWQELEESAEPLLFVAATDETAAEELKEIKEEVEALKKQYYDLLLQAHHQRCVALAAYLSRDLAEVEAMPDLSALEAEWKDLAQSSIFTPIEPQAHPTIAKTYVVEGTQWIVKELDQYPAKVSITLRAYSKQIAELTQDAVLGKWEATLNLIALFVLPAPKEGQHSNINYQIFGGKPDSMDLKTGEFDAQMEAYMQHNKKLLLKQPIGVVLGLRDFFLPSWVASYAPQMRAVLAIF